METTNNHKVALGGRYFNAIQNEDGSITVTSLLKVIGRQSKEVFRVKDLINKTIFKIDRTFLLDDYSLLEPDAYVLFNIVDLQDDIQDVIVTMFKYTDMKENNTIPYCVCRQNITNLYSAMIRTQDVNSYTAKDVGMCMSIDSIPDGIDYNIMTACNDISDRSIVAAYLDDSLDDILSCVKQSKYDKVLNQLFQDHVKNIKEEVNFSDPVHMGYCKTLGVLLDNNDFMYDYRRAFGIVEVDMFLSEGLKEDGTLTPLASQIMSKTFNKIIHGETIIKFDKDIDLESITRQYTLLCDKADIVYIMTYSHQEDLPVYSEESVEHEIVLNETGTVNRNGRIYSPEDASSVFDKYLE